MDRYAIANFQNWSDPTTWDSGLGVPGPGDVVRFNGNTVYADTNINVAELRNDAGGAAIAGGYLYGSSVAYDLSITAAAIRAFITNCVDIGAQAGKRVTINADCYGSDTTTAYRGVYARNYVTVNGDAYGGAASSAYGVYYTGQGSIHNGDCYGGSNSNAHGIASYSTDFAGFGNAYGGTVGNGVSLSGGIWTGNLYGSDVSTKEGGYFSNGTRIYGNAYAGATARGAYLNNSYFFGDCYGGVGTNTYGAYGYGGTIVQGNAYGGSGQRSYGVNMAGGIFAGSGYSGTGSISYGAYLSYGIGVIETADGTLGTNNYGVYCTNGTCVSVQTKIGGEWALALTGNSVESLEEFPFIGGGEGGSGVIVVEDG